MHNNFVQTKTLQSSLLKIEFCGLTNYSQGLKLQETALKKVSENSERIVVWGLEHPPVMTLGLRAHNIPMQRIAPQGWPYEVVKIKRGGLATVHSEGQLVIYPSLNLKTWNFAVHEFVKILFLATQKTLKRFNVDSTIDVCDQPGVYTSVGKIAFCGLKIENNITQHGLSINLNNNLNLFNNFVSCGQHQARYDKLQNYQDVQLENFFILWCEFFFEELKLSQKPVADLNYCPRSL